jgi:ribonuclease HII
MGVSLRQERALLRDGARLVCGMDEVGRGALSGPVSVGAVLVDASVRALPGVRDSKLLSPAARESLVPRIRRWSLGWAVGHAEASEIDEVGIIAALRRAGLRALRQLPTRPDVVLLDGSHDWLTPPAHGSLLDGDLLDGELLDPGPADSPPPVTTRVKADLTCTSVAAASVLAKVERDRLMAERHGRHPEYGWAANKGYASPDHLAALTELGPCREHRRSWRLPG